MNHAIIITALSLVSAGAALASIYTTVAKQCDAQHGTWGGDPLRVCVEGILYLQFNQGACAALRPDGKPVPCEFKYVTKGIKR